MRGSDPGETLGIREYRPGDPIRQIHWKLSQKTDKLMLRETGLAVSDEILLLFESAPSPEPTEEDAPAALEALLSLSASLLEEGLPHTIAWKSGEALQTAEVAREEDEKAAREALLFSQAPSSEEGVAEAFVRESGRRFARSVLFSARPDTDVIPLLESGRVTLVLPKDCAALAAPAGVRVFAFPRAAEGELLELEI